MEEDSAQTFDRVTLEIKPFKNDQETPKENDRPETPKKGDTTKLWRRILDSRLNIGGLLGDPTPPQGTPRPTKPAPAIPTKIEHPHGSARWANQQLEKAETLLEKWNIVDQIIISSPQELEIALKILNGRPAKEAEELQSRIAVLGGKGVTIPVKDAAKILRIPRALIVQRLLMDRIEKTPKPSQDMLCEILGALKNADGTMGVARSIMAYFDQELRKIEPLPGGDADLSAQTMMNGLTGNFGMKIQQEFGLADRLRPETQSPGKNMENALKLAICMQDPKAIARAFARLGVEISDTEPESAEKK